MPEMLSIAINDYPNWDRPLRGCLNDSVAWTTWFSRRGWTTESLWNEQATGARIQAAIERLMVTAEPGDRVAIHFSGHGSQVVDIGGDEPDRLDECYCPWDVLDHGPLRDDVLYRIFQQRREGVRLYLIADCCHSGSLHRGPRSAGIRYRPLERGNHGERPRVLPAVVRTAGLLLAACGEGERAREITIAGQTYGVLTYTARRALDQLGPGATDRAWLMEIQKGVKRLAQTPQLAGNRQLMDEPVFGESP